MSHRIGLTLLVLGLATVPASAQLVVVDPANLVQTVLIAQRAQQAYEQLRAEYQLIAQMAKRWGTLMRTAFLRLRSAALMPRALRTADHGLKG